MKHTESAGGIVLNQRGQVLVVNQRGNAWSLPKGHIDDKEDALTAAKREIHEETGVHELELIKPLGQYVRSRIGLHGGEDHSEMKTIHMFLFRTKQMALKPLDPMNPEARWVDRDKVESLLTHAKDREFFASVVGEL